jgi:histidinol-phosphatase (PHP family)
MHSTGSDGNLTPQEVVKEAIEQGIHFMCFTDHYRRPSELDSCWDTSKFHPKEYVKDIRSLQKKYKDKIDISFGAEFDWLPNDIDWLKNELSKEDYDFAIGSVHLFFKGKQVIPFMFSNGEGEQWVLAAKEFGGNKEMVKEYYKEMRAMIKSKIFDSVGHFDVIKIHNKDSMLFSENEDWYKKEVLMTLDVLKDSKMAMEINTSGLSRDVAMQYPSLWILKEAKKRNIPITIGSDAHSRERVGKDLDFAYNFAREAGYTSIVRFKARKMISVEI